MRYIQNRAYKEETLKLLMDKMIFFSKTESVSVEDIMEQWLRSIKNDVRYSTYVKYENLSGNHIIPRLGKEIIWTVNRETIECFVQSCIVDGRVDGGVLSRKTINDILIILGLAFKYAEEKYGINLPDIKLLKQPRKEARVLTKAEQNTLTEYLLKDIDIFKLGVLISLNTGLRIGEVCALQWEDIADGSINVTKTMQRLKCEDGGTKVVIGEPKSLSSKRKIPLPEFMIPYIECFRRNEGFVLYTDRKKYAEPRCMQMKFAAIADDLHLENVTFHTLRHTFATRCMEAGFDVKTLSEILGHSDVKTTLNKYVHSSFELKQQNMSKLSLLIT